jgi:4-hydroxy-3-methylbut-2-enyl diphosphate reductase
MPEPCPAPPPSPLRIVLANPRGFCAGVERAIDIVERALALYGPPVYVRHEIVHNQRVVSELRAEGAVFVEEVDEIPQGAVTVFSAHGVARKVEAAADGKRLQVLDATCPLVTKVHTEGRRFERQGREIVLIGYRGHAEVEGTLGQLDRPAHVVVSVEEARALQPDAPERLAYITETTLSIDDTQEIIDVLKERFPAIVGPSANDICYATQNRQAAIRELATRGVELILVMGAANSSNSNRLCEIAAACGVEGLLLPDADALPRERVDAVGAVGISAGASAPEALVREVIARLAEWRPVAVESLDGVTENIRFNLPRSLLAAGGEGEALRRLRAATKSPR